MSWDFTGHHIKVYLRSGKKLSGKCLLDGRSELVLETNDKKIMKVNKRYVILSLIEDMIEDEFVDEDESTTLFFE